MGKVYVSESRGRIWIPLEENILSCLEDPFKQGMYFLPIGTRPTLEEKVFQNSQGQYPPLSYDWVHFASNLGFSIEYSCSSRIVSPDGREAYTLIQLSDGYIIDHVKTRGGNIRMSFLAPNIMKIMDEGRYFIFDGQYEEVSKAIRTRDYKFVEPNEGEFLTGWVLRLKKEVLEQRRRLITNEFVERVNKEYFKSLKPLTKEELVELLVNVDIGY